MADTKFSDFPAGGPLENSDIIVGLRAGVNTQFSYDAPIVYAARNGATNITIIPTGTSELFFPTVAIDTDGGYDAPTSTYTIPKYGKYYISYDILGSGTGGALTALYFFDTAVYVNGLFVASGYSSNRNSVVTNGNTINANNSGFMIRQFSIGDTINIHGVNNGNINVTVSAANFGVHYLSN